MKPLDVISIVIMVASLVNLYLTMGKLKRMRNENYNLLLENHKLSMKLLGYEKRA